MNNFVNTRPLSLSLPPSLSLRSLMISLWTPLLLLETPWELQNRCMNFLSSDLRTLFR